MKKCMCVLVVAIVAGMLCGCMGLSRVDAVFVQKDNELTRAFVPSAMYAIEKLSEADGGYTVEDKAKLKLYGQEILKNCDAWDAKLGLGEAD